VSLGGQVVARGSGGWIWFDTVEQQFDAAAEQIISNSVKWLELSVQFPTTKQAMKIGYVEQASVGRLNCAMLHDAHSPKARNGAFTDAVSWDIDKVHIAPVQSSLWKSPVSGQSYCLRYRVALDGARPSQRAHLFIAAMFTNQEVNAGGRHAYEGLFSVAGTLCGKKVTGQTWTEVSPPPACDLHGGATDAVGPLARLICSGDGWVRQLFALSWGMPWPARVVPRVPGPLPRRRRAA